MKSAYPFFYENFRCIADKCPDSCCKEWDVVLDDESWDYYGKVGGEFGKKLSSVMTIDDDGDSIFVLQNGKCPFWNDKGLCDIYINLGEESLCETCKRFPRIVQDYGSFEERTLSFACPEATRLMLESSDNFSLKTTDNGKPCEEICYDEDLMSFLLETREALFEIIGDKKTSAYEKILRCLSFCHKAQKCIDSGDFSEITQSDGDFSALCLDAKRVFEFLSKLDIMTDRWKNLMKAAQNAEITSDDIYNFRNYAENFDGEFTSLAFYYIFRYYLNAVDSLDVMFTAKSLALAYSSIFLLECAEYKSGKTLDFKRRTELFCLYSKEVEHSYENIETLERAFAEESVL